eukprot:jgi/Bigna1/74995/fgenesh1_pg.32_\
MSSISEDLQTKTLHEMVFGGNLLKIEHVPSGVSVSFTAAAALRKLYIRFFFKYLPLCNQFPKNCDTFKCEKKSTVKVQMADRWVKRMERMGLKDHALAFDWTYTTKYKGDMEVNGSRIEGEQDVAPNSSDDIDCKGKTEERNRKSTTTTIDTKATSSDRSKIQAQSFTSTVTNSSSSSGKERPSPKSTTNSALMTRTTLTTKTASSMITESNGKEIDTAMLMRPDRILWFKDMTLYEDELADNGNSKLDIKIRVMSTCFLVRMRFFLRVDGVLVRAKDTRYFHDFSKNYMLREFQEREDTVKGLAQLPIFDQKRVGKDVIFGNPEILVRSLSLHNRRVDEIKLGGSNLAAMLYSSSMRTGILIEHTYVLHFVVSATLRRGVEARKRIPLPSVPYGCIGVRRASIIKCIREVK